LQVEKTRFLIATEEQRVVEKTAETQRRKALIEVRPFAAVEEKHHHPLQSI
jgi:hypothetical protein